VRCIQPLCHLSGGPQAVFISGRWSSNQALPAAQGRRGRLRDKAPRGADTTLTAQPVALSIGSHQIVHGSVPIPEGFKPRETTVRILDRTAGEQLGMRVLRVR